MARRYHEHHGMTVPYLRAVMPISLRLTQGTGWGSNKITLMRLAVPTAEPDPAARMRQLHRIAQAAREEWSLPATGASGSPRARTPEEEGNARLGRVLVTVVAAHPARPG